MRASHHCVVPVAFVTMTAPCQQQQQQHAVISSQHSPRLRWHRVIRFRVVSNGAIDYLTRFVSKMTDYVSSGTINPTTTTPSFYSNVRLHFALVCSSRSAYTYSVSSVAIEILYASRSSEAVLRNLRLYCMQRRLGRLVSTATTKCSEPNVLPVT